MGLLKKLCLPNATLFFLSQVTLMMKYDGGHEGDVDDHDVEDDSDEGGHGGKDDSDDPPPSACDQLRLHHRLLCA